MSLKLLKVFSVTALVLLTFVALGPATWQPRSGIGWEIDHFVGYFIFTLMFCIAWPRPLVVGGALMVFAVLLEGLQAFMPDRSSYYMRQCTAQAGCWRRLCLLSSSSEYEGGLIGETQTPRKRHRRLNSLACKLGLEGIDGGTLVEHFAYGWNARMFKGLFKGGSGHSRH